MIVIRTISFFVASISIASSLAAQVSDLSNFDSAKERIDNYLVEADGDLDSTGVILRLSRADAENTGELTVSEITLVQIANEKKRLQYSSNQTSRPDEAIPRRSECLWFEGKLKGRGYLVNSPNAFGESLDIERDPSKTDEISKRKANYFGPLIEHMYIDPFGLALTNVSGIAGTLTSMDNAVRSWVTKWKLVDEEYSEGKLVSRWITNNKNFMTELVFEDKQGGMPVLMRRYGIDKNLKQVKGYVCETRTIWIKVIDEGEKWIPQKVILTDEDQGGSRTLNFEIEFIPSAKVNDIVETLNWKELHENKKSKWYATITEKLRIETKGAKPGVSKMLE